MNFQNRFLLTLDNTPESNTIKEILKSPLGLVAELSKLLFENNFDKIKNNLDSIKNFVAGISRTEKLGKNYKIANYYPYLFSFHQFFHSSYRARQGKTLEEFIKKIIRKNDKNIEVADKKIDKSKIMSTVFTKYDSLLDLDVIAKKAKNEVLVIQLRSRDDTGGTTAKSSLVEALGDVMKLKIKTGSSLLYLVSIWDEIKGVQKKATIKKIYSALNPYLVNISEKNFIQNLDKGINIKKGIILKLTYGTSELAESLNQWINSAKCIGPATIKRMIGKLKKWDDLWLAYAMSSIELENLNINNHNNVKYLNSLTKNIKYDLTKLDKNEEFTSLANSLASKITPAWENDSIPLRSPAEKIHYIRDLLLLKFVYETS